MKPYNKLNEYFLIDSINELLEIEGTFNLLIKDESRELFIENIIGAYDSSNMKDQFHDKSDITIITTSGNIPLSIKLPTAAFYASYSSDEHISEIFDKSLDIAESRGYNLSKDSDDKYTINPSRLGIEATHKIIENGMFGSDILSMGGGIIIYDHANIAFKLHDQNTYCLNVSLLIKTMEDVTEDNLGDYYPVISIQNHSMKRIGNKSGIEARLSTMKNLGKHAKHLIYQHQI